ncbi:SH3 domain-containing protein [Solidesulfovibrio sp.]|uniref:SH3 domain-containing protein n=1 Tax=Solidesulfovibrio sp. TaxID=2910990 RepID=UPI002B216304|nr:SH3 domain-containing protein [Solidesulfovibrio sp.]MEA5089991.1 SH3 domain-containing protein [Solidesulfovibrio sp.]HML59750.1 SH3 domain-containing protein [Solidesulfovibrio sp.]
MLRKMPAKACALALAAIVVLTVGCAGREQAAVSANGGATYTVRAALLNLLECPSLSCTVVADLHSGDKVAVLTPDINGWYQVREVSTGRVGYVLSRFVGP